MTKLTVSFLFVIFGIILASQNPSNALLQNISGILIGSGVTLFLSIALPMIQEWDREYGYTLIPFSLSVRNDAYNSDVYEHYNLAGVDIDSELGTDEERRNISYI